MVSAVTVSFKTPSEPAPGFVKTCERVRQHSSNAVQVSPVELQAAMQEQLEGLQDALIRSLYLASLESRTPLTQLSDSAIGYAAFEAIRRG